MQFVDDGASVSDFQEPKLNERLVHTRYGFTIRLERTDPYGFIYIRWHKGATPEAISGAYQTYDLAREALNNYLNNNTFDKVVDEPVEIDKAVYKKRFRKTETEQ